MLRSVAYSCTVMWTADKPFNSLPDLPPPIDVESKHVLKQVTEARAALASLDQAARRIPNPSVLLNSIPLLEAQASSEIENIVTTADELFTADQLDAESARPEAKEALRYRAALLDGVRSVRQRPLSTNTLIAICSTLQAREMRVRDLAGTFIGNPVTREAIYTPPEGQRLLLERLDAWARFAHSNATLDPLVLMALAHYQFEAIHPFSDGNGRTGRIVNILLLIERGLLREPILYLSRYIIQNKSEYYRLLLAVTAEASWEEWVSFMLEGIRQTALSTVEKIDDIQLLHREMQAELRAALPGGANADLLDVLFEQPFCRITTVMERCGVSRPTATKWLKLLAEAEILVPLKLGKSLIFVNGRFFSLLTRSERAPEPTPTLF